MDEDIYSSISEEINLSNDAAYSFADKIVTLSTGALALSVVFRKSLIGTQDPAHIWLLQVSWIGFMATILLGTFWGLAKFRVHRNMARQLGTTSERRLEISDPGWKYHLLWRCMMATFPIAIITFTLFALLNMR